MSDDTDVAVEAPADGVAVSDEAQRVADALPATETASQKALDLIQEQCVLFVISSSAWSGQYTARDAKVLVGGDEVAKELLTKPRWNLIPKEWRVRMASYGGRALRTARGYAIPFLVKGQYFVGLSQSDQCLTEVEAIRQEQRQAVREFVAEYPNMIDRLREKLADKFVKVAKFLPRQERVSSRFDLQVLPLKVSLVQLLDSNTGVGVLRESKAAMNRKVMELVAEMIETPRQQLAEAVGNLRTLIEGEKRFDDRSLEAVRKRLSLLKGFSFLADDQLLGAMRSLDQRLGQATAQQVRLGGEVARDLVDALKGVEKTAEKDAQEGLAVQKFRRRITL